MAAQYEEINGQPEWLTKRVAVLENALAVADDELHMLSQYRKRAHRLDRDMGHSERLFRDSEEWDTMEALAAAARRDIRNFAQL